jgi:hypothetical protein
LNELLQTDAKTSWSSTVVSMLGALATLKRRVSSSSSLPHVCVCVCIYVVMTRCARHVITTHLASNSV